VATTNASTLCTLSLLGGSTIGPDRRSYSISNNESEHSHLSLDIGANFITDEYKTV
jgi:hypothetical protein